MKTQSDNVAHAVPLHRFVRPSSFVSTETNPANGPTPAEALAAAIKRLEEVAYARGFEAALSRLEMLAAIVPESVTKSQLVEMLKSEVTACIGEWNATRRPNDLALAQRGLGRSVAEEKEGSSHE